MGVEDVKKLREMTSMGINECKKALEEARGDFDKALKVLRERGAQVIDKKSGRATSQGLIESYIHFGGNLGAIIEINRTDNLKKFVKDIAMHVAALSPLYIKKEDIPADVLAKAENADEFVKQHCLLNQAYVKDNQITVSEYLKNVVAQTGENIIIRRFSRFSLGE